MANLSDIQIKNWIKKREHFEGKSDGDGLYLCFRKEFSLPRWNFRYRFAGKQRVMSLGTYGQLTLSDARRTAKELRAMVSLGYDVASEKQERKHKDLEVINAFTFANLADEYMDNKIKGKWTNYKAIKARIDKDIKPNLGALLVEAVKPAHIDTMLKAIVERNAPSVANDILRWTKRIFDYAIKRHIVSYNPASAFNNSDAGGKEEARSRALSKAELIALFEAMRNTQGFTESNYLTIKLLLLLAVRKGELTKARREEFDLDSGLWHLPVDRTKTNAAITIPLPKPAIEALRTLMAVSHSSEYLLPARKSQLHKLPYIHENTLNVAMSKVKALLPDIPAFCIHDLRRTARSHLAALGVESHIAERCLNHKLGGIEGVYNQYDYLDERRKALDLWAKFVVSCETGKEWNVTPIKKRATQ